MLFAPAGGERLRHLEPAPIITGAVVRAHAGALALMAGRVEAGCRAFLLLAVWLDDIDSAVPMQGPLDKLVEPSLRHFPAFVRRLPSRRRSFAGLQPAPIVFGEGQPNPKALTFAAPPQYDRCPRLIPDGFGRRDRWGRSSCGHRLPADCHPQRAEGQVFPAQIRSQPLRDRGRRNGPWSADHSRCRNSSGGTRRHRHSHR